MYDYLRGTLAGKDPGAAVVEAGGMGYRIAITAAAFDRLPVPGTEVKILLHHTINAEQGEQRLYGFVDETERLVFRQLLEVQRIGPSVAMRILSNAGVDQLVNAIAGGDLVFLKRVKGVGAKMAERLIVELQEPLSKLGILKAANATAPKTGATSNQRDAIAALVSLGYKPAAAEKAVAGAFEKTGEGADTAALIRIALQQV